MSASARLLEDRGEAGSSANFFRCREFLREEGATHTLLIETPSGEAALPLVVREIPGTDLMDAVSPYGYPGAELNGSPLDTGQIDWSATGLVSLFIRDRVGSPSLPGGTKRSTLQIADPVLPRKSRMSDRQQIRKNEQRGYAVRSSSGPGSSEEDREAFAAVYEQTMRRAAAGERYFFTRGYFDAVLASDHSWLFLVDGPDGGGVAAGSIAVASDGFLHYFLTGTADEDLRDAPNKNLLEAIITLAEELEAPLNLGGGIEPGDGLEEFKRGFANREEPFLTHEIVCDPEEYECLTRGGGETAFFPAYRA